MAKKRTKRALMRTVVNLPPRARALNHLTARANWAREAIETIEGVTERHEQLLAKLLEARRNPERLNLFVEIAEKFEALTGDIEAMRSEFQYLKKRVEERSASVHELQRVVETLIHNAPRSWKDVHGKLQRVYIGKPLDPDDLG